MTVDVDVLSQIIQRVREGSVKSRSSLSEFLNRNYYDLSQGFQGRIISFRIFAEALAAAGITDANGASPTEAGLRKAWYRTKIRATVNSTMKVKATAQRTPVRLPNSGRDGSDREGSTPGNDPTPLAAAKTDTKALLASLSGPVLPAAIPIRHFRSKGDQP